MPTEDAVLTQKKFVRAPTCTGMSFFPPHFGHCCKPVTSATLVKSCAPPENADALIAVRVQNSSNW